VSALLATLSELTAQRKDPALFALSDAEATELAEWLARAIVLFLAQKKAVVRAIVIARAAPAAGAPN
jgi:hypothetical protein